MPFPYTLRLSVYILIIFFQNTCSVLSAKEKNPDKAGFSIQCQNFDVDDRIMGIYVKPRGNVRIKFLAPASVEHFQLICKTDKNFKKHGNGWNWQAPAEAGLHRFKILQTNELDSMMLNIFVLIPFTEIDNGKLNNCSIGDYPKIPLKYQQRDYQNPQGLIEVTRENEETWVSPNFQLKQFVCKQSGDYPKYVVLSTKLLIKLELIIDELNKNGIKCKSFTIMSGYRTPYYNKAIGNVKYSRHIYGTAADFYIDESPADGVMDDINKDGINDIKDAKVIYDIIESLSKDPAFNYYLGGLSAYKKNASHGPFVHTDVRGYRARW